MNAPAPPRRRSKWQTFGISLACLVVALAYLLCYYDSSPPDDQDLAYPQFDEHTTTGNPLPSLVESLLRDRAHEYEALPLAVRRHEPGTSEEAREFLARHEVSLAAFKQLMSSDPTAWRWIWPMFEDDPDGTKKSPLSTLSQMGNLTFLQVAVQRASGQQEAALRSVLEAMRYAHGLERTPGGGILLQVVAATIKARGLAALEPLLTQPATTADQLRSVKAFLMTMEPDRTAYQQAIRADYSQVKKILQDIKAGRRLPGMIYDPSKSSKPKSSFLRPLPLVKPNMMSDIHSRYERPIIQALDTSWSAALKAADPDQGSIAPANDSLTYWLDINLLGKRSMRMLLFPEQRVLQRQLDSLALLRQSVIILAFREYELEHHRLPDSLQELVPKYLITIPLDPFDDQPMRWNAALQSAYSVSADGKDDGGTYDQKARQHRQKDLITPYWWGPHVTAQRELPKPPLPDKPRPRKKPPLRPSPPVSPPPTAS